MRLRFLIAVLSLFTSALAATIPLESRQVGLVANELSGPCKNVTFIFARGSIELGNMGLICGPQTANLLEAKYGSNNVAVQGVDYAALLITNLIPQGADPNGIADMKNKLTTAATKCPNTIIVAGGYSQGAAITHEAIKTLDSNVRNRIAGVVTFGDTRKLQDGGRIPNYPTSQTLIICAPGDLVCLGTLIVTPAHLTYGAYASKAANFLIEQIGRVAK